MDETGVFTDVQSVIGYERSVGKQRDKEDGIRENSQSGDSVNVMLIKVSSYLRTMNEGGRRRNERFGRRGLNSDRRRRSKRKRRIILWKRGRGASEGKGRSD
jgi:hypothetical protein